MFNLSWLPKIMYWPKLDVSFIAVNGCINRVIGTNTNVYLI